MSNQDSNDSDIDNTVVEKLSVKDNNQSTKSILIESDTATISTSEGTTPVPIISGEEDPAENIDDNLSSSGGSGSSNSPKLTAEWTVHAQLTFRNKKPGEKTTKEFNSSNTNNDDSNSPIKVYYKWSSNDAKDSEKFPENIPKNDNCQREETEKKARADIIKTSNSKIPLLNSKNDKKHRDSLGKGKSESFRSTTTTADSGRSSNQPRKPPKYGTRCKSTCNIILSAVADFIPTSKDGTIPSDTEPLTFNTTASYTVSPEQNKIGPTSKKAAQNQFSSKICSLRDAFSQTSDTEARYLKSTQFPLYEQQSVDSNDKDGKRRIPYQQRRHTDSVIPMPNHRKTSSLPVGEGSSLMPSSLKSPPYKSPSLPKIPPLPTQMLQNLANQAAYGSVPESGAGSSSKSDTKKPPRTVHIDVYCTGSDDEEDDDEDDLDFSMSSDENKHDMESNSTPQTVLDTEQMLLKHQRAGKTDLPRRFLDQQQQLKQQQKELHRLGLSPNTLQRSKSGSNVKSPIPKFLLNSEQPKPEMLANVGHAITKSTTAEEVNESKQLLFKKHIGDQRNSKLAVRNNKHIHKDMSDDAISSNYPNSSRSTMRDMTCSSISSKAMSSFDMESSWKETEISVARTDSFDYENATDRMRIQNMERLWNGSSIEQQFYQSDNFYPDEYQRLNYRSVQPSPETPPFRNNSPQKTYLSPNISPEVSFRNQSLKYTLNSENQAYGSPQGHSYSTPPQQPYPSPGGQSFTRNPPNYNASPQPYLGPIHPPTPTRPISPHQNRIHQFFQGYSQQTNDPVQYPWRQRQQDTTTSTTSDYELFPKPNQLSSSYYGLTNQTIPERDEPNNSNNNSTDNSPNFIQRQSSPSQQQQSPSNQKYSTMPHYLSHQFAQRNQRYTSEDRNPFDLPDKRTRVMFTADYNKSGSESSTLQSNLSGYTTEYLAKARRFGSVVTQMRKPGHHIGPAKNPDCECEHCRHWFTERTELQNAGQGRGRAYSMGDTPKGVFWLTRSNN